MSSRFDRRLSGRSQHAVTAARDEAILRLFSAGLEHAWQHCRINPQETRMFSGVVSHSEESGAGLGAAELVEEWWQQLGDASRGIALRRHRFGW
jgi:hypothetical protein